MHVLLGSFAFMCIFPFLYVIIISISNEQSLAENGYQLIPEQWSLDAYKYLWDMKAQVLQAYGVTIFVTVVGTFLSVTVISMYAYAISRKQFKFRKQFTFIAFFTMLFSGGMVPFYIVMTQFLDLKNTMWALILPMAVNAFYIIIMRTFFLRSVPEAILESARIDGAGEMRIFLTIVLPLSIPGIATIALFSTLAYWNDWFNALLFIDDPNKIPLQSLLMRIENNMDFIKQNAMLSNQNSAILKSIPQDSARMAMVVIATLPIALSYPFFQKYFIKGLTIGGVKD
ncbi:MULTISPECIES: carbohydrate ABC transporter permease [Rossellomorea]|nr:carbohydrate ABC transporter permease [Rossellomorea marisflavi]MBV6685788.1 carbohydrate ABC transporter permease [Bacillus sp. JRC01]MCM2591527.1 carbohydrate ABC transporter permease [Rossellomorea marisflavi]MCM2606749.1 carbohydrate ABC transporter permease [Rossellomorea marisflavi]MDR4935354.1 carbohydrate ABC transporter permease [Rossellomorea marisflavi]MDW4528337.1 carbohydrate ABC transporter permease [Rossellomorea marisflavi]